MPDTDRLTLTIRTDQAEMLEEMSESDDPRWRSKSEAARHLLDEADRVDDLETELERVKNEKQVIVQEVQSEEIQAHEDADERDSFFGRLKWLVRGE